MIKGCRPQIVTQDTIRDGYCFAESEILDGMDSAGHDWATASVRAAGALSEGDHRTYALWTLVEERL